MPNFEFHRSTDDPSQSGPPRESNARTSLFYRSLFGSGRENTSDPSRPSGSSLINRVYDRLRRRSSRRSASDETSSAPSTENVPQEGTQPLRFVPVEFHGRRIHIIPNSTDATGRQTWADIVNNDEAYRHPDALRYDGGAPIRRYEGRRSMEKTEEQDQVEVLVEYTCDYKDERIKRGDPIPEDEFLRMTNGIRQYYSRSDLGVAYAASREEVKPVIQKMRQRLRNNNPEEGISVTQRPSSSERRNLPLDEEFPLPRNPHAPI